MDATGISTVAEILSATGPYGFLAILGAAYWKLTQKKDREMRELFDRVVKLAEAQTAAIYELKAVMRSLSQKASRVAGMLRSDCA